MSILPHSLSKYAIGAFAALVLVGGSFVATSGDVAYNSQSLLAAVFSTFSSAPSITISRNPNSPSGTLIPGRSQTLAVFDVVPKSMTQAGTIESLPLEVTFLRALSSSGAPTVGLRDFIVNYQYCIPKGNVYAYGYKYGYAGTYCRTKTVAPGPVAWSGTGYTMKITDPLPVFPDQISATLTLNGTPFFTSNPSLQRQIFTRARVQSGGIAKTTQCRTVQYGYQNAYGYKKCEPVSPTLNVSLAYGNWLPVSTTYGYGTTTGTGALSLSTDASSPSYKLVAAGAVDVPVAAYKLHASGENVNVQKVGLILASGASTDLVKVSLYDGSTKVGEAYFVGVSTTTVATLTQNIQVPKDYDKTLTIKADLSPIGTGQATTRSGALVRVESGSVQGVGANSGNLILSTGSTATAGIRVMKSYPTAALDTSLPSSGIADGRLIRFALSANPAGPVGIKQLTFKTNALNTTLSNVALFAFTDSSYSSPVSGQGLGGQIGTSVNPANGASFSVKTSPLPLQIPAGGKYYFELRGSVVGATPGSSITTTFLGDAAPASTMKPTDANSFIWSPNSTTTAMFSANDWANGFGVPGLPSGGLVFTRSSSGTTPSTVSFSASPLSGQAPLTVSFTGDTGAGCGGGYFTLSYGDGQSDEIAIPADLCRGTFKKTHSYATTGTYTASFVPKTGVALTQTITVSGDVPPPAQCADGIDNDANGQADYPADSGCSSATDTTESTATTSQNRAPNKPIISGPSSGFVGESYSFTVSATDPDGDQIRYGHNNGTASQSVVVWIPGTGYLGSGSARTIEYLSWSTAGTKTIWAKVEDSKGASSPWASFTFTVKAPLVPKIDRGGTGETMTP